MEFYTQKQFKLSDYGLFQFPTGWNSTKPRQNTQHHHSVSIPNGMECYLLISSMNISLVSLFQFPTGWNSTDALILVCGAGLRFQFPTGWNSTLLLSSLLVIYLVSIPNGMEFYQKAETESEWNKMFQFPTGWNSTGMDKNFRRLARDVSIPKEIDYSPNLY